MAHLACVPIHGPLSGSILLETRRFADVPPPSDPPTRHRRLALIAWLAIHLSMNQRIKSTNIITPETCFIIIILIIYSISDWFPMNYLILFTLCQIELFSMAIQNITRIAMAIDQMNMNSNRL